MNRTATPKRVRRNKIAPITINGIPITRGMRATIDLPLPKLYTYTRMTMPVQVVRGKREGPRLFVSATIHGDELNGVEIIRRLLKHKALNRLSGTLIAVPIVNVYGVIHHSRYMPDRRDLNRAFPGSERGSMASQVAHLFMHEIVANATHGIDLHTGTLHRCNLPQIRANLDGLETSRLAKVFDVPVLLNSNIRDGSLREAVAERGIPMLLYEAGEALRFDEVSIRAGLRGIINVMRELGMLAKTRTRRRYIPEPYVARASTWLRAPKSGILRTIAPLGAHVKKGEVISIISDPFGDTEHEVHAELGGIVIGRTTIPLIHQGEAVYHVACFADIEEVAHHVESFQTEHAQISPFDAEPVIV
jgi:predicted deacylase